MAKFYINVGGWADDIAKDFNIAEKSTIPIMKMALYEGAKALADAGRKAAAAHGLGAGFGVAPFKTDGDGPQTSVGFRKEGDDGYFVNRWGEVTPYDLVANVLEYGSSRTPATHFMSHAFKSARAGAKAAMRAKFQEEITKLLGE